ncbi:hypothetical protein PanWU01x14_298230, partial [Parasponia andersonii]
QHGLTLHMLRGLCPAGRADAIHTWPMGGLPIQAIRVHPTYTARHDSASRIDAIYASGHPVVTLRMLLRHTPTGRMDVISIWPISSIPMQAVQMLFAHGLWVATPSMLHSHSHTGHADVICTWPTSGHPHMPHRHGLVGHSDVIHAWPSKLPSVLAARVAFRALATKGVASYTCCARAM